VALLQWACPVLTAVFSFIILREKLTTAGILGAGIILFGIVAEILQGEKTPAGGRRRTGPGDTSR
jgi:drug/metabolite transporter (DMT)-like permease